MLRLRHILKLRWVVLVSVALASVQLYDRFRPIRQIIDTPRQRIAQEACWQIADNLPSVASPCKLVVFCIKGDDDGYVTETLKDVISRTGKFDILPDSVITHLFKELGLQQKEMGDTKKALQAAKNAKATYLITTRIESFTANRSRGKINMSASLYQVNDAKLVVPEINVNLPPKTKALPVMLGGVAWFTALIFMPFIFYKPVKTALASESNSKIFLMLATLTAIDVILAYIINGLNLNLMLLAVALVLAVAANYKTMNWINSNR